MQLLVLTAEREQTLAEMAWSLLPHGIDVAGAAWVAGQPPEFDIELQGWALALRVGYPPNEPCFDAIITLLRRFRAGEPLITFDDELQLSSEPVPA